MLASWLLLLLLFLLLLWLLAADYWLPVACLLDAG